MNRRYSWEYADTESDENLNGDFDVHENIFYRVVQDEASVCVAGCVVDQRSIRRQGKAILSFMFPQIEENSERNQCVEPVNKQSLKAMMANGTK